MKPSASFVKGARTLALTTSSILAIITLASPAYAQESSPDLKALLGEINALKAEQARSAARIAQLESQLSKATPPAQPSPTSAPAAKSTPQAANSSLLPAGLTLQGDLRMRYEGNFSDADGPDRERGVLRARFRANYAVNNWLSLGTQIATGDSDDPNSTDVTLSNFNDDLDISLDQVFMKAQFGDLTLMAGKFPQPFVRSELVWDGDVSPQGLSASYSRTFGGITTKATGLFFLVDEAAGGADSTMRGAQIGIDTGAKNPWRFELAGAYYDYKLGSVAGGDSGDFRGNRLGTNGRYLRDFNLVDVIGAVTYQGFGPRWPVRIVGDYVKNLEAESGADTGYGIDLLVGRASTPKDWRVSYGYAETEVDAVFAAFSHDNTGISTNYLQHTLALDYVMAKNIILTGTYYQYRPNDVRFAGSNAVHDWLQRLRLNLLVNF